MISKYFDVLRSCIRRPALKMEILRLEDETTSETESNQNIDSDGSLNISLQNGIRRTFNITMVNIDGNYTPDPNRIWARYRVKLYLGLYIGEQEYFIPQGVFVLENPNAISNSSYQVVKLNFLDKFSLLDGTLGGELDQEYTVLAGTTVSQAIKDILEKSGDPIQPMIQNELWDATIPSNISKDIGDNLGSILLEIASTFSANVYYDTTGSLVFAKNTNADEKESLWSFAQNDFNYMGISQSYPFSDIFNSVLVKGGTVNDQTITAEANNMDLTSNISIPNLGYKRVKVVSNQYILSQSMAQELAEYELKKLISLQSSISISSVPMYHLDIDEVIDLSDQILKLDRTRFLIMKISLPFKIGSEMTVDAVQVSR